MKKHQSKYTLTEYMLAIGIVLMVLPVVFAGLGASREQQRLSTCMSNLHQIGGSLSIYQADYDAMEPIEGKALQYWQLGLPSPRMFADGFIKAYVKDSRVLRCPDYHNRTPLDRLSTTYYWVPNIDAIYAKKFKFSNVVAQRGLYTPLVIDDQHNALTDTSTSSANSFQQVLVLRLNQQVQARKVPLREYYPSF